MCQAAWKMRNTIRLGGLAARSALSALLVVAIKIGEARSLKDRITMSAPLANRLSRLLVGVVNAQSLPRHLLVAAESQSATMQQTSAGNRNGFVQNGMGCAAQALEVSYKRVGMARPQYFDK